MIAAITRFIWNTALFCLTIIIPHHGALSHLNSLISLSQRLTSDPPTSRNGNVNIIETGDNDNESTLALCYLPYLIWFTNGDDGVPNNADGSYDGLAAISLAMEHLNTGNGTIIPEVSGINQRCPLRFTTRAFDTEAQQSVGVDHLIEMTDRGNTEQLLPCAILGAAYSSISIPTSIISGLRGFPQISPISTSAVLDDKSQFKLFGRTIPNDDGTAIPLLVRLAMWGVNYVAILHVDDAYGNAFAKGIRLAAQKEYPNLRVETVDIVYGADDDKVSEAIKLLRDTQFQYIFGILHSEDLDRIMTEAHKQGIAGTGRHTWLFSDGVASHPVGREFPVGSSLEKAYRGTGVMRAVGGAPGIDSYDKLARSMQQLAGNEKDMSYLLDHLPNYQGGKMVNHSIVTSQESFLKSPVLGFVVPFLYDAVIAIGLASCGLVESSNNNEYFTGEELFQALLNTTFDGTSGRIIFDPETGTRVPQSVLFSLTNFIDDEDASATQGMVKFKEIETDLFRSGEWESIYTYTFNDGTGDIPPDLPNLETNANYLSTGMKVVGLILSGTIVALALGFSFWTYHNSKRGVVRSAQPIFLHIISAGTLFMGLSIIPFTLDLGVTDQEGADAACMAFPWLLAIGFSLTFSALFTKAYRINQIMQSAARYKRLKLTAVDVMKPMATLLLLNIVVLTVWSIIDPLEAKTVVVDKDKFDRNVETYGVCGSNHAYIFLATLCMINFGSLLFALFQAYKARNISTDLQESKYVFTAMALILIVSCIGIPVIIIARDKVAASYFVTACLIFVVCSSIQLLVFIPKVQALRIKDKIARESSTATIIASDLSADDGMEIKNMIDAHAELEKENREQKQTIHELERLLSKERKQAENVENSWHPTDDDDASCSSERKKITTFYEEDDDNPSVNSSSIKSIGIESEISWHSAHCG